LWAFSPCSRSCLSLGILCVSTDTTTPPMGAFQQKLNTLSFFRSHFSCNSFPLSISSLLSLITNFFYLSFFFTPSRPASSPFVSFLLHQQSLLYNSTATLFLSVSFLSFLLSQYTRNINSPMKWPNQNFVLQNFNYEK
jgi:hypothetical protein